MDKQRAAVFLDRDGIINADTSILEHPDRICLTPEGIDALRNLGRRYLLFVFARPDFSGKRIAPREVAYINLALDKLLRNSGVDILEWCVCPRALKDQRGCIDSDPFFLKQTAEKYGFNLKRSFIISINPQDFPATEALGIFSLFLLSGPSVTHLGNLPDDRLVFHSLEHAASWIGKHPIPMVDMDRALTDGACSIKAGGLVAFPTETVYGLGADAFNHLAVARIFEVKKRPLHNPLIVHIADIAQLEQLVDEVSPVALRLINRYWPGPLSLVFRKKSAVPDIVTAGQPTVAVRMPAHPMASELIRRSKTPIAAPSANAFGRTSATSAQHVLDQLQNVCDVLIDGGACRIGVESTVVTVTGTKPILLRPGAIPIEDMETTADTSILRKYMLPMENNPESPGMMNTHYQTATPIHIVEDCLPFAGRTDIGFLLFGQTGDTFAGPTRNLSHTSDLKEAAVNLYLAMRELDALGLKAIVSKLLPETGIGYAINDRLRKASFKPDGFDSQKD
jgi:L-threonylcarbamoyladenylate synthase